jgi:hypothetical protein
VDLIRKRRVQGKGNKFNLFQILKVPQSSQEINNSLRMKQSSLFKADKRLREHRGIEPNREISKWTRRLSL